MKFKWVIGICIFILLPAVSAVKINEIMYNPLGEDSKFEFIELEGSRSLSNYSIEGINFIFPENSSINGYLIIAKEGFEERYRIAPSYTFSGSLKNSGESLRIIFNNTTIDEVNYTDITDEGFSLEFNGTEFVSSLVENGTPFYLNSVLNYSFEANSTNSTNTTNTTNTTNETVNTTLLNESNTTTTNATNTTHNSSLNETNNQTILNATEIEQEIEAVTENVESPAIQSFYTLTKKYVEDKEIKFFTYIHNKAETGKDLQAVFDHNGIPQSQSISLPADQKQKLTFITQLKAGDNHFSLTLFDDGFAVDLKTHELTAEAIEEEKDAEEEEEAESDIKETTEIKEQTIETKTLNAVPKAENQAGKEVVERFKNDTPIQIQTGHEVYEGSNTKNKRLIGYMLLGFSALLNIIFIWRR